MPFTPKVWKDDPDHTTPLTAAAVADLETRVTTYAETYGNANFAITHAPIAWAASTTYAVNQIVIYNGQAYIANTAHTSTSTFDTSKWTPFGGTSTTSLIQCSGHSLTNGYGLADTSMRASSRLAGLIGSAQEWNQSINGAVLGWPDTSGGPGGISWMAQRLKRYRRKAPYSAESDVVLLQWGKNDMPQLCQTSLNAAAPLPEALALFKNALTTCITLYRSSARFYAGDKTTNLDANISLGTATNWTAVANPAQPASKRGSGAVSGSVGYLTTTTNGAGGVVNLTIPGDYPGSSVCPLYVMFIADPNTTAGTITASGAATGTFDLVQTTNTKPGTCDKQNNLPGLVVWRFTGSAISASATGAPQTLTLTPSALAGGTWGLAEFGIEAEFPPIVAVLDITKDLGGGNTIYSNVANTDLATWNTGIQAVIATFDQYALYVPVDALIGGLGETANATLNGAITAISPATGGNLTVNANSLPASGAVFSGDAAGEIISYTGGGGTTSLTGITRGAYGTTAGAWANARKFWQITPSAVPNFYIGGIAGDGLHWSERAQSITAGAVFSAIQNLLSNLPIAKYRVGPGRADVRCTVGCSAEQLILASSAAAGILYFNQSYIDTAAIQDPTTATQAGYKSFVIPSDGLYRIDAKVEFSIGKRVSTGAAATAGVRFLTIAKNPQIISGNYVLLGGGQANGSLCPVTTYPTTADQTAAFPADLSTGGTYELRKGDVLTVYALCNAASGAGLNTTITNNPLTAGGTSITLAAGIAFVNNDYVRLDDEIVLITAGGGTTTLTVTRAQLGTSAASHATGAAIFSGISVQNPTMQITRLQAI